MFDIQKIASHDIARLLEGSDVLTGYNVRLDIFVPLASRDLSALLDSEYEVARRKAEELAKDSEKNKIYQRQCRFVSYYIAPPLPPGEDFLEGENGPPLGKGHEECPGIFTHRILKTIGERDFGRPRDGWAYTMVRGQLGYAQGTIWIFPKDSNQCVIDDSIHKKFDYVAQSDICLPSFVFGMINLYGNYSPAACQAKLIYAQPTKEEGLAQ